MKANSKSDFVSGFEDWLPTICAATGNAETAPENIDGISLLPTLQGESQQQRPFLYREFSGYGGQQSIRVGDWKAIRQNMNRGNTKVELYNLASDVSEQNNVASEEPERVAQLLALMQQEHTKSELYPLRPFDAPAIKPKR